MAELPQDIADQAIRIREICQAKIDAALASTTLNIEGQRLACAQAVYTALQQMQPLRARFEGASSASTTSLTKSLFGANNLTGADAMSMRDAVARANQLADANEASSLLASAIQTGDNQLAQAICQRAFNAATDPAQALFGGSSWSRVVDQYIAAFPSTEQEILSLSANIRSQSQQAMDNLTAEFYFSVPQPQIIRDIQQSNLAGFIANRGGQVPSETPLTDSLGRPWS